MITTPSFQLRRAWIRLNRVTINVFTLIFLLASLAASAVAFFYPLEIETRESTVWLHVLALRQGINLYEHNQVAFINMIHGPFDPLCKLLIATLFPFLDSWQVTRFAVVVLPYLFLAIAWKLIARSSAESALHALYLGSMGYLFLVVSAKEFIFVGRSDATVAILLLLLVFISISCTPKTDWTGALYGFVWGTLGTLGMLTNWRIMPIVITVLIFTMWISIHVNQATRRHTLIYLLFCLMACVGIWTVLLFYQFDFDLSLYYKHFFGIYSQDSGWGNRPYGHGSLIWFLGSLFKPTAHPESLKGGPLLLVLAVYALIPGKKEIANKAWALLGSFIFIICTAAYYLNYYGGGQWYFIPFLITLWFWYCTNYSRISQARQALLGVVLLGLLGLNFQTVITPSLKRVSTMQQAYNFLEHLRALQETNTILSEDTFFFRTSYQGELIDMGDTVSAVSKSGYYGEEFHKTVNHHFAQTQSHPPDYILTGFTESPELRQLINEKYILIAHGPANYTANGRGESQLFIRKDLITQAREKFCCVN
jgi:hypothetical protein